MYQILTDRQKEVLILIARGYRSKEAAAYLDLTDRTIKHHMTNIMQKLGARNGIQAIMLAIQQGQIGIGEIDVNLELDLQEAPW